LKPAWANSSQDLISKISITERARGLAQSEAPEFKPSTAKKKKKKKFIYFKIRLKCIE
jgi:hypothetical protein